jgi:hypothetical protein
VARRVWGLSHRAREKMLGEDEPEGGTHVDTRHTLEAEDLSDVPPGERQRFPYVTWVRNG